MTKRLFYVLACVVFASILALELLVASPVSALLINTPVPTLTQIVNTQAAPNYGLGLDYSCPGNGQLPYGYGTVTPGAGWLSSCGQCLPSGGNPTVNPGQFTGTPWSGTGTPPTPGVIGGAGGYSGSGGTAQPTMELYTPSPTATLTPAYISASYYLWGRSMWFQSTVAENEPFHSAYFWGDIDDLPNLNVYVRSVSGQNVTVYYSYYLSWYDTPDRPEVRFTNDVTDTGWLGPASGGDAVAIGYGTLPAGASNAGAALFEHRTTGTNGWSGYHHGSFQLYLSVVGPGGLNTPTPSPTPGGNDPTPGAGAADGHFCYAVMASTVDDFTGLNVDWGTPISQTCYVLGGYEIGLDSPAVGLPSMMASFLNDILDAPTLIVEPQTICVRQTSFSVMVFNFNLPIVTFLAFILAVGTVRIWVTTIPGLAAAGQKSGS